jgi:ABC-type histidine transport system ATPase subunit
MNYGEVIEQGNPKEIFSNPKTPQLKEYLIEGN